MSQMFGIYCTHILFNRVSKQRQLRPHIVTLFTFQFLGESVTLHNIESVIKYQCQIEVNCKKCLFFFCSGSIQFLTDLLYISWITLVINYIHGMRKKKQKLNNFYMTKKLHTMSFNNRNTSIRVILPLFESSFLVI